MEIRSRSRSWLGATAGDGEQPDLQDNPTFDEAVDLYRVSLQQMLWHLVEFGHLPAPATATNAPDTGTPLLHDEPMSTTLAFACRS